MTPQRILLLNPPARDRVIRDYYCSKTTKSSYLYPPIDLIVQSGWLAPLGELALIDAVVARLGTAEALDRAAAFCPTAVVMLVGAVCWEDDLAFLSALRQRLPNATLALSGDVVQADPAGALKSLPDADVVLGDFHRGDFAALLEGRTGSVFRAAWREGREIRQADRGRPRKGKVDPPLPRHALFDHPGYRFPFVRGERFGVVLTDFGCRWGCTFCVMSTLGFTTRSVDNVLEELRMLRRLGKTDVLLLDQTFGADRERALTLTRRMAAEKLDLGWVTFTRADVVDAESLAAWREAGCHTLIFGVEFADPAQHRRYRKGYTPPDVARGLELARAAGIRTVGTFLLGLPEDTDESLAATIALALQLPLDFASFNIAVPRHGTPFREGALREGLTDGSPRMDQAGATVAMPTRALGTAAVARWHGRAVRSFYLRPRWLARRLLAVRSAWELGHHLREGASLIRRAGLK